MSQWHDACKVTLPIHDCRRRFASVNWGFFVWFLFGDRRLLGSRQKSARYQILRASTLFWGSEIHITSTKGNSPGESSSEKQKWFSEIKVVFLFHWFYNLFFFNAGTLIPVFKLQISLWSRWIISANKCIALLYLVYLD